MTPSPAFAGYDGGGREEAKPSLASNFLIVGADFGMGPQHRIHRLEQIVHPGLADGALDHDDQFRLVG